MANRISLSQLYNTLGITGQSRTSLGSLCSNEHGKINMWAKYKPQNIASAKPLTEAQRKAANFGLRPTNVFSSVQKLIDSFGNGVENGFTYVGVPRKGVDRMRVSDFDGYSHAAAAPWWLMDAEIDVEVPEDGELNLQLTLRQPADDSGAVRFKDMLMSGENFAQWYPGVIVFDAYDIYVMTSDKTVEQTKGNCVLDFGATVLGYAGNYTVIPIVARTRIAPRDSDIGVSVMQIGESSLLTLADWQAPHSMSVKANFYPNSKDIDMELTLKNRGDSSFTFEGLTVLVSDSRTGSSSRQIGTLADTTVEAGGSRTVTATYPSSVLSGMSSASSFLMVECSSPDVDDTGWEPIMEGFNPGGGGWIPDTGA